jgi:hypothetical protein
MNARKDDLDGVLKLVSFFKDMKAINDEFFYDIQVDSDNAKKNSFWSNASYRGGYQDFGDCVTLDTTYKTNRFHMPLGVFVGANHHLQSTIFAVALVRDEDAKSFKWIFDTFLRCMNYKHPTCILIGNNNKNNSLIFFSSGFCHLQNIHCLVCFDWYFAGKRIRN